MSGGTVLQALAVAFAGLAMYLTPPPGADAAAVLAGWPRLALYALSGVIFAHTVAQQADGAGTDHDVTAARMHGHLRQRRAELSARARWTAWGPRSTGRGVYWLLGLGVVSSVGVAGVGVTLLSRGIADPLGPPLWFLSMLLLLGGTLLPRVRRLGWAARWPARAEEVPPVGRWQWLGPLVLIGLLIVAAALRLPALGEIPLGINADEGDRAAGALDVLSGHAPASWFDSGWFYINMVYFRLLATSMLAFGANVAGGRMLNGIAGTGFVAAIAWLGCRHFGWRVGLLATALAAGMGIALQHSRFISETGPTALLWAISIGGFLEGARSGRPWAWVLAGVSGGLSLYFYPSARLWAAGAALSLLVIWLHQRQHRLWLGCALAAAGALLASAPYLVHLSQKRDEATLRYLQTTVLDPANQSRLPYLTPPEPPLELAALQVERTLGLFDRYPDGGGFMPTGHPLFPRPLAALALVGAAYAFARAWSDARLAVLSVWFWLGLSGVAVTVETPDYLRAVGMLPALCLVLAITLVDIVDRVADARAGWRPPLQRSLSVAVPVLLGVSLMALESTSYFNTFRTLPSSWGPSTREGQAVEALGANGPVYSLEMQEHLVNSGWVRLLAPTAQRGRVPNPGRELPAVASAVPGQSADALRPAILPADGQGLGVLLAADANQDAYVGILKQLYPQGLLGDARDGRQSYTVSPAALASTRGVTLVMQSGATRPVERFGDIPSDSVVPAELTWRAGVRFVRGGDYRLLVTAPGQARVRLDGLDVARGSGDSGTPFASNVLAAPGLHFLELVADVANPTQRVALTVGDASAADKHELTPGETYRPMDAAWGLLARIDRPSSAARDLPEPANAFLDATIAMAFFDPELGEVSAPNVITWTGVLLVPFPGLYRMAFAAEDRMRLEIDGRLVDVVSVGPDQWARVGLGSALELTAGPHAVRVTLEVSHAGRELARWNWVPPKPGGALDATTDWSVVPPRVLRPDPPAAVVR